MAFFSSADGVQLFYDEIGAGHRLAFIREFAGDSRSYEPQVRFFSRYYRCIVYNRRGYPPSAVPETPSSYSQDYARDDLVSLLDFLKIERTHLIGLSTGGFGALHAAIVQPERISAMVVAGWPVRNPRTVGGGMIDTVAPAAQAGRRTT
jgi:pimeloyl-ACP methyl ester carboxylesterase